MIVKRFLFFLAFLTILFVPIFASGTVLFEQTLSGTNTNGYPSIMQNPALVPNNDVFLADDFTTGAQLWSISTIFIPGNFRSASGYPAPGSTSTLANATMLHWEIWANNAGVPAGNPTSGTPVWSLSVAPSDPRVTIEDGSGGYGSNVTLDLSATPITTLSTSTTYWLIFYPEMDAMTYAQYGRQIASTTNGFETQIITPGLEPPAPQNWAPMDSSVPEWGLSSPDLAFRLEGVTGPQLSVSPAGPINFANTQTGQTSSATEVTISNTGTTELAVSSINVAGTDNTQFSVAVGGSDPCEDLSPNIDAGDSCTVNVTFGPTTVGAKTATLDVASNGGSTSITLNGTGINPNISVSPAGPINFNSVQTGQTSSATEVTIENTGTTQLIVSSIAVTGGDNTQFSVAVGGSDPCEDLSPNIDAGDSCTVNVTFGPTTVGAKTSTLTIVSNDYGTPNATVTLNGTGINPNISVSPAGPINFNSVQTGQTSPATEVTISNTGTTELIIDTAIAITGANSNQFAVAVGGTNPCATLTPTIDAGQNCTVNVTFSPTSTGAKTASLTIISNDFDTGTANITLNGTGTDPDISVTPVGPIDFGSIFIGNTSSNTEVTITNQGAGPLTITEISIGGTNPGDFGVAVGGANPCPSLTPTIAAGENCTVNLTFSPTSAGARTATLDVTSNASPASITLNGTGLGGTISLLSPNGGSFATGDTIKVEWQVKDTVSSVTARYSCDSGMTWTNIVKKQSVASTTFDWDLPLVKKNKTKCTVKVFAFNANNKQLGSAKSSSPFSIKVMEITAPASGETVAPGSYEITWTENALSGVVAEVRPYYSLDNGTTWKAIKPWLDADTGSATWEVPEKAKNKCKVKVVLKDASGKTVAQAVSDTFSIVP